MLLHLIEDWKGALDKNSVVGTVIMDLSKAFDLIPHDLLLAKLSAGLLIFHGKKSKISRDFQGQIRGKIGGFRGEKVKICGKIGQFRGRKVKIRRKIIQFRRILAEKSEISNNFQGQILRKIGRFHRKFRWGKLRQETISKKQPISLDFFWQISLKSINSGSI